ncbi:MAG: S41 family peptidase [Oscillospiraceae bacterium]|nr:S41 family peptidase [Oscillospiraceae bacterium]
MNKFFRALSYVLVALAASLVTLALFGEKMTKLEQLQALIGAKFIGEANTGEMEDAAAAAMIDALGDRWSYYIPAEEYDDLLEQKHNAYVGVGITIENVTEGDGIPVLQVAKDGPAWEAGIQPGDVITAVDGVTVAEMGVSDAKNRISGEAGTTVALTVLREGQELTLSVERRLIQTVVAQGQMLEGNIGLVQIVNFNDKCASETIAAIEELLEKGAQSLIFDVRFNGGGYKHEMVDILNYLLPEGPLFRSVYYDGRESVDESDAECLQLPMAVLVNGSSYSAAEFFAAALREYDAAVVVGEQTSGKGYFQNVFTLKDGSGVGLSVGQYFTPNGVCLEGVGITPDIPVAVDAQTASGIYNSTVAPADDPQVQAAVEYLTGKQG